VKIVRISLATFCALLFIVTGIISMLLFNLDQKAFDPETYQQVFAREKFYQRLPTIIAKALVTAPQTDDLPIAMQGLTVENWENFIRDILPPEDLRGMGEDTLDSLFAYINNESDYAGISLIPLKESMAGEAGTEAVLRLMKTQPDCTAAEIAKITVEFFEGNTSLCNPPPEAMPLITPIIKAQLQYTAEVIPDLVTLASADPSSAEGDPREGLRAIRLLMRLSPLVPLGILLVLSLLVVRSLRGWLAWWGIPIFITGIIATLISLIGAPFVGLLLLRFLIRNETEYIPPVFLDSGSQMATAIVEQLLKPTLFQGLILTVIGILLIAGMLLLKKGIKTEAETDPENA
jgi:hypothetical protein